MPLMSDPLARRDLLRGWLVLPAALGLVARAVSDAAAAPGAPCSAPTSPATEGPYYKAQPPRRASLVEPGVPGTPLTVTGTVRGSDCRPIAGAIVDFWQADDAGEYDNRGFRLRGYQLTDAEGRYELTTIVPGLYPGRTRHIHVKLQPPGRPVLTTQLYFPDEAGNARDGLFDRALVVAWREAPGRGGRAATFDFVLDDRAAFRRSER
jgi:protocatechuate 3,4-dioxygenase beta subunit